LKIGWNDLRMVLVMCAVEGQEGHCISVGPLYLRCLWIDRDVVNL